jgi:hypothetical protein
VMTGATFRGHGAHAVLAHVGERHRWAGVLQCDYPKRQYQRELARAASTRSE